MLKTVSLGLGLAVAGLAAAEDAVDLTPFLQGSPYHLAQLSPDGRHLAVTAQIADRTLLLILDRDSMQPKAKVSGSAGSAVSEFRWVSEDRVIVALAERYGALERPLPTGELHAINADGSGARTLVGLENAVGTERVGILAEDAAAWLIDDLPRDDRHVLIARAEYGDGNPKTRIERLNVRNGQRRLVARAPIPRAWFTTDPAGSARFAAGADADNYNRLYYRAKDNEDWTLINDERRSGHQEHALGFSADGQIAYLQVEQTAGPDAVYAWDTRTDQRSLVAQDARVDPSEVVSSADGAVLGVRFVDAGLRTVYFDPESPEAILQARLDRSFPGAAVRLDAARAAADWRLFHVASDREPGSWFLYNVQQKKAELLFQAYKLDPAQMAATTLHSIQARDGLAIPVLLTRAAAHPKAGPTVLLVHGGPFGLYDDWFFDRDAQVLNAAGYHVLRVNYRGSGNYGRQFELAGAREWGAKMQDDLADAAHWAIETGIADPERIAIVGSSYGAYAALMGAATEPDLYRCAVGHVGVYDLERMVSEGQRGAGWVGRWMRDWVGSGKTLRERSPTTLAARIQVPVLLVAGAEDQIAPPAHTKAMARAIKEAKGEVDTLYVAGEGHGFYQAENQRRYYTRLLGFLQQHLGGLPAAQ